MTISRVIQRGKTGAEKRLCALRWVGSTSHLHEWALGRIPLKGFTQHGWPSLAPLPYVTLKLVGHSQFTMIHDSHSTRHCNQCLLWGDHIRPCHIFACSWGTLGDRMAAARALGFQRMDGLPSNQGLFSGSFGSFHVKEGPLPGAFYINVWGEEDSSLARGEASVLPMATWGLIFIPFGRRGESGLTSVVLNGGTRGEGV